MCLRPLGSWELMVVTFPVFGFHQLFQNQWALAGKDR